MHDQFYEENYFKRIVFDGCQLEEIFKPIYRSTAAKGLIFSSESEHRHANSIMGKKEVSVEKIGLW